MFESGYQGSREAERAADGQSAGDYPESLTYNTRA